MKSFFPRSFSIPVDAFLRGHGEELSSFVSFLGSPTYEFYYNIFLLEKGLLIRTKSQENAGKRSTYRTEIHNLY
jgi:hypothetical protein